MRIQNNISAMNAGRNLRKNQKSLNKNLEKLSSGYRIVRAADDAAGLAISESMRASIACYEQSENNAQDGISLVQTADGAMQEIQDMLNRMMTLSTQAANGTLTNEDREKIQDEIDEIIKDISRIKNDTDFNGIPLLQGDEGVSYVKPTIKGGLPDWVKRTQDGVLGGTDPESGNTTYTSQETFTYTDAGGSAQTVVAHVEHVAARLDFSNGFNKTDLLGEDVGFHTTCCTCHNHYSIKFTNESTSNMVQSGDHFIFEIGIRDVTTAEELVDAIIAGTSSGNPAGHYTRMTDIPGKPGVLVIYDERPGQSVTSLPAGATDAKYQPGKYSYTADTIVTPSKNSGMGLFDQGVAYDKNEVVVGDITIQVGDTEAGSIAIDLPEVTLNLLKINGLSVRTEDSAQNAIASIKEGINYLSGERARMGAYQNRMEHSYNSVANAAENLSQSESRIRDTDMAEQMMGYTKNNILIQSAQSMLAQSNQVPQGVLQLLQ